MYNLGSPSGWQRRKTIKEFMHKHNPRENPGYAYNMLQSHTWWYTIFNIISRTSLAEVYALLFCSSSLFMDNLMHFFATNSRPLFTGNLPIVIVIVIIIKLLWYMYTKTNSSWLCSWSYQVEECSLGHSNSCSFHLYLNNIDYRWTFHIHWYLKQKINEQVKYSVKWNDKFKLQFSVNA